MKFFEIKIAIIYSMCACYAWTLRIDLGLPPCGFEENKLTILSAEASGEHVDGLGYTHYVFQSYDGVADTSYEKCWYAEGKQNNWVEYEIDSAKIFCVQILTKPNYLSSAANYRISVCNNGVCESCGTVGTIIANQFTKVFCPLGGSGGLVGTHVRVEDPNDSEWMPICEIEIYGKAQGLPILSVEKSGEHVNGAGYTHQVSLSYDGDEDTAYEKCWYAEGRENGWVEYEINEALVSSVEILTRPNFLSVTALYQISVCHCGTCSICGTVGTMEANKFKAVVCPSGGLLGNRVRVDNPNQSDWMPICEFTIYGKAVV